MRNFILAVASLLILSGCYASLPVMDGTYRDTPAVSRYDFRIHFQPSWDTINEKCQLPHTVVACVNTIRYADRYDSEVFITAPSGGGDVYWAETLLHELFHPIFDWRH